MEDEYKVLADGRIYLPSLKMHLSAFSPHEYCLEQFNTDSATWHFGIVACNKKGMTSRENMDCLHKLHFYPILMGVSCLGLLGTISIYLILPELRNLPGKNLLSMSTALLFGYGFLIFEQAFVATPESLGRFACIALGKETNYDKFEILRGVIFAFQPC